MSGCPAKPHVGVLTPKSFLKSRAQISLPVSGVEAKQITLRAERIDFAVVDQRSRARSAGIADGVGAIILVRPKQLAVCFVEAKHSLSARDSPAIERVLGLLAALGKLPIHQINPSIGDRRPGIAAADRHAPAHRRSVCRELFEDARLPPDPIALRPEPLRPVVGAERWKSEGQNEKSESERHGRRLEDGDQKVRLMEGATFVDESEAGVSSGKNSDSTSSAVIGPPRAHP